MTNSFKIGIAGLGTVGCGVIEIVQNHVDLLEQHAGRKIEIKAVSARSRDKDRGVDMSVYDWEDNAVNLSDRDDLDCVVELIGGEEGTAKELCERALQHKKHVVTANKALLAHSGYEFAKLAEDAGVGLAYEASIAGGIPVVKALREGLAANQINSISGILNGTCNYILSTMEETGREFDDVLAEAQEKGYAETPPDLDVDGIDAAHKLCLLSALGFGVKPDFEALSIEGIRNVSSADIQKAKSNEQVIRLVGSAKPGVAALKPEYIPVGSPLAGITGPQNAVLISANPVGDIFLTGAGAGKGPTASAVVADIVDLARGEIRPVFGVHHSLLK